MKKFIAGIVMSALLFMALAMPALANNKWNGRSNWTNGTANGSKDTSCNGSGSSAADYYGGYC